MVSIFTDDALIEILQRLTASRGWQESYACKQVSGGGTLLERMRAGSGVTLRRGNRIISRVSEFWPADEPWPADIPRPTPKTKEDAA